MRKVVNQRHWFSKIKVIELYKKLHQLTKLPAKKVQWSTSWLLLITRKCASLSLRMKFKTFFTKKTAIILICHSFLICPSQNLTTTSWKIRIKFYLFRMMWKLKMVIKIKLTLRLQNCSLLKGLKTWQMIIFPKTWPIFKPSRTPFTTNIINNDWPLKYALCILLGLARF